MLNAIRRSALAHGNKGRVVVVAGRAAPAQRSLSYTVVGEQWKAEGSDEAAPLNDLFNGEWDQDAGDTVQKEVSVFDRQQIHTSTATAEQLIRSQELDYDSAESAPSCWGRIDDTSMSPKVFEAALAKARANEAQADEATNSKD